jgi:putative ABC transport system permease protein
MTWLKQLLNRRRRYDDISVSIEEHIEERAEELMAEGMARKEAEQAARREFGNAALIEQRSREVWQWPTLESILADIRFALRQLVKSPSFALTAVLTLSLGIAINATMFSMVSAFLLPHLPGRDPQDIVVASSVNSDSQFQPEANPASAPNYLAWRSNTRLFAEMAADNEFLTGSLSQPGQQPDAVSYAAVSPNYFSVFGVGPSLGRGFLPGDDQPGHNHILLLSHGLWERRFGSDASIVGRTVRLNREDYTVAGVMPASFRMLGFSPKLWIPLTLTAADGAPDARKNRFLYLFARLAPGVTLQQARARMNVLAQQAQKDFPAAEQHWGASVRTLSDFLIYNFDIRAALSVMMTVVIFILFIACANVAGLTLTRAVGRQKELAIRLSLGASRTRVVRQLLTEGVVIALLGGAAGLFLSYFGICALRAGLSFNEFIADVPVRLDTNVLLFAVAVSLFSALLSSTLPALKASRSDINVDLKGETRGSTSGRSHNRLRVLLVGGETALALFLLTGTCLLIHGVYTLERQKLGFVHDHLLTAGLVLDHARYPDAAKQAQFVNNAVAQLQQIPGVQTVAAASDLPSSGPGSVSVHIKGQAEARPGEQRSALDVVITPGYLSAIGVPILRGRRFTASDDASAPRVVIVNQEFVHKYFHDRDPIGEHIQLDTPGTAPAWSQIVGVAGNIKTYSDLPAVDPQVYEAWPQRPVASFSFMLRSSVEPDSLIPALRHDLAQIDPELPLLRVMSMDQVLNAQNNGDPLFLKLLATFAILALVLSAIGIYGLVAYSVGQRTQEIGIRIALGAKTADISRMVLREGFKVAAIGSCIGLVLALPLPRVFASMFQGLIVNAPQVYPIVLAVMLLVAFGAILGPALRAARVDPTSALRNE